MSAGVRAIVDVRRFPGSRRHPHFRREAMAEWLGAAGIDYRWLPSLGGRRSVQPGSPNVGLREPALQGYADHMATGEFARGVAELLAVADMAPVAIMCAESVWWRCHRRLLADYLVLIEDRTVQHLFHDGRRQPHPPTPAARRSGPHVIYDVGTQRTLLDD